MSTVVSHIPAPTGTAGFVTTTLATAGRTVRKMLRSPQILGIAIVQSIMFLLMFRYVLGGAIGVEGVEYVDYLVPGFVIAGLLFTAGGASVSVSEDAATGLYDRLRSLPISDWAVFTGRCIADALLMVIVALVTTAVGFIIGFSLDASAGDVVLALLLLVVYSLTCASIFVLLGLISGSAQAAQGLGLLAVPFSFVSSAFVPIESMPGAVQAFAKAQPLTFWVNSWRGLLLGDPVTRSFDHGLSYYVIGGLVWAVALLVVFTPIALRAYRRR